MSTGESRNDAPVSSGSGRMTPKRRAPYTLSAGTVIGGVYEVIKPLGRGGMGEVYLVRHTKLDIERAVKILLPKIVTAKPLFADRFMQEARLAIQIQHPNIINVMDANKDENLNIYYIVMELVDGESIRTIIRQNGTFTEEDTLEIALCVGQALEEADKHGIVHRDIKPDNIMLTRDNRVKLADLGIAKSPSDTSHGDLTAPDVLIGTPAYVSPEQVANAQKVDCRADIYSMGVSMYEMLTGEKPYRGTSTVDILAHLFNENEPVPDVCERNPDVSPKTAELIRMMMAKELSKRPQNWKVLCRKIKKIQKELNKVLTEETQTTTSGPRPRIAPEKPSGLILGGMEKPFDWKALKPRLKQVAMIAVPLVVGFVISMLIGNGFLSVSTYRKASSRLVLFWWGSPWREDCEKYELTPTLDVMFFSAPMKTVWVEQRKPLIPLPINEPVTPPSPPPAEDGKGYGKIVFRLPTGDVNGVSEYLRQKKGEKKMTVSGEKIGQISIPVEDDLEIPSGEHELSIALPGFEEFRPSVTVAGGEETVQYLNLRPLHGTIELRCNVEPFQIWTVATKEWQAKKNGEQMDVESLRDVRLLARADGYAEKELTIKVEPGETKGVDVELEKKRSYVVSADEEREMEEAMREYKKEEYSKALKIWKKLAEKGNPEAKYHVGEVLEGTKTDGNKFRYPDRREAYKYFKEAADNEYAPAYYKMGYYYENGVEELKPDRDLGLRWYERGARVKEKECLKRMGQIRNAEKAYKNALEYFREAYNADSNDPETVECLIELYRQPETRNDNEYLNLKRKLKEMKTRGLRE